MISAFLRIVVASAFVILVACAVGLFVMAGVAQSHDVVRLPVPPSTFIGSSAPAAAYATAYVAPMRYSTFASIERVEQQAFFHGEKEAFRDEHELSYQGTKWGLGYTMSYILEKGTEPQTLTVALTLNPVDPKGQARYLIKVLKPVMRGLLPYLLDRMVVLAPD